MKNSINNNDFDMSAFVLDTKVDQPVVNTPVISDSSVYNIDDSSNTVMNTNDENQDFNQKIHSRNINENVEKSSKSDDNLLKRRNNRKLNRYIKEKRNDDNDNIVINSEKKIIMTQTLSINYIYSSRTITVTKTRTKAVQFDTAFATNTQSLSNSRPTILKNDKKKTK